MAHDGRTWQHWGQRKSHTVSRRRPRPPSPWARSMVQWRRILPPLSESEVKIGDSGSSDIEMNVVPRRTRAIPMVELHRLGVPSMRVVVTTPVAQVDASDERHVSSAWLPTPDDDHL